MLGDRDVLAVLCLFKGASTTELVIFRGLKGQSCSCPALIRLHFHTYFYTVMLVAISEFGLMFYINGYRKLKVPLGTFDNDKEILIEYCVSNLCQICQKKTLIIIFKI